MMKQLLVCVLILSCFCGAASANAQPWPDKVELIYFYSPACTLCDDADKLLTDIEESSGISVRRYNLNDKESLTLMKNLLEARGLEPELAGAAPAVFSANGYIIGPIDETELNRLVAGEKLTMQNVNRPSLGIFLAGLADGVNPCTLNVLLILLSICLLSQTESALKVGLGFIAGIVSVYFLVGIGLGKILEPLREFSLVIHLIYLGIGLALIISSITQFGDGTTLKRNVGKLITKIRKSGITLISAFVIGSLCSVFEFVCTGQIYLPMVLYMSTQEIGSFIGGLLLYNIAFALPMVALVVALGIGTDTVFVQRVIKLDVIESGSRWVMRLLGVILIIQGGLGLYQ